jgi:hypothetical protein
MSGQKLHAAAFAAAELQHGQIRVLRGLSDKPLKQLNIILRSRLDWTDRGVFCSINAAPMLHHSVAWPRSREMLG